MLQHKQQMGLPIERRGISEFEKTANALITIVARDFWTRNRRCRRCRKSVGQYVTKTFELGRPPAKKISTAAALAVVAATTWFVVQALACQKYVVRSPGFSLSDAKSAF